MNKMVHEIPRRPRDSAGADARALRCRGGPGADGAALRAAARTAADMEAVVAARLPAVLEGSPAETWAREKAWDQDALLREAGAEVVEFRSSERRVFTVRSPSRTGQTLRLQDDDAADAVISLERGPLAKLLESDPAADGRFAYFSGPLALSADLEETLRDAATFAVVDEAIRPFADAHRILHIGHAGVTAQLHYDKSNNFLAQVRGRKHVILFPPHLHWALRVFPVVHPSRRQSQLDILVDEIDELSADIDWAALEDACQSVVLHEGEVLYLPPFWFHQVEYLDFAVSVSIVSPSIPEFYFARHVHPVKLPAASDNLRQDAARLFLGRILPAGFVQRLVRSRYGLVGGRALPGREHQGEDSCADADVLYKLNATLDAVVGRALAGLGSLQDQGFSTESELLLADLAEETARSAIDDVQDVHRFLVGMSAA